MNDSALFPPSRSAALDRLAEFAPRAGHAYAAGRNTDPGADHPAAVSRLSPYLRYRLITEREVVAAVLNRHSFDAAEKYVQEVLWRTYWKGWLEMRPAVWARFLQERDRQRDGFRDTRALAAAEAGTTGIDGFDDWARQLLTTGYLHNHARMWFASIWIFTLRLPWALGADFFLRHLLDADAASNTLSWRWVAGLQTVGKAYFATADNIARYTNGRFAPTGLAQDGVPLSEPPVEAARPLAEVTPPTPGEPALLLVTHEDLHPESVFTGRGAAGDASPGETAVSAVFLAADGGLLWGDAARGFARAAITDTAVRAKAHFDCSVEVGETLDAPTLIAAARGAGVRRIVTAYAPVGPVAAALTRLVPSLAEHGMTLAPVRRDWDTQFWPHAKKGFFSFKERIPVLLREGGTP